MALLHSSMPRTAPFIGCPGKKGFAAPRTRTLCRRQFAPVAALPCRDQKAGHVSVDRLLKASVAGLLASGIMWLSPSSAWADVQTVSPQVVTQMARPLPKQTVDKGKVWLVFIGGAIVLFGGTLVLENNPQFFPAIVRANEAMREATKRIEEQEKRMQREQELLRLRQQEFDAEQRQMAAVQQGIREAKAKVLGTSSAPQASRAATTPPAATTATPAANAAPVHAPSPDASPSASASTPRTEPAVTVAVSAAIAETRGDANGVTGTNVGAAPYVVVEDVVPDMGAVAWPSAPPAAAASARPVGDVNADGGAGASEEDVESAARLARLQGFVSETVAGSKGAMEAFKSQRQ